MSDFKPTKDQLQILEQLKEVTEPYYVYTDQMMAIAMWIDAEFKHKSEANEANKQPPTKALPLHGVVPMLHLIAKTLDDAIEGVDADNETECGKISDVVELLTGIANDNSMFLRN